MEMEGCGKVFQKSGTTQNLLEMRANSFRISGSLHIGVQIDLRDHFLENWSLGLRIIIIPSNCLPHLWENTIAGFKPRRFFVSKRESGHSDPAITAQGMLAKKKKNRKQHVKIVAENYWSLRKPHKKQKQKILQLEVAFMTFPFQVDPWE